MRTVTRLSAVCGLLWLAAAGPAGAQDLEYGPPYVLEGPFDMPGAIAAAADGTVLVAETGAHRVRHFTLAPGDLVRRPEWRTFGEVADVADASALAGPQGIAVDAHGTVYVADTTRGEVKVYRPDGAGGYVLASRLAPGGPPAEDPRPLLRPRDVAVGSDGRIYVLDSGNDRVLVADGPDAGRWTLGPANPEWSEPYGLDVAADGTIYVADTGQHRVLRLPPSGGQEVIGRYGMESPALRYPRDVAIGPRDGRLYVADTHNHRIAVFDGDGRLHRSLGHAPLLGRPEKLAFGGDGRLFAVDAVNGWVVVWTREARPDATSTAGYDAYLRDQAGDDGGEPRDALAMASPDVLVRHRPDLDLDVAERFGIAAIGDEPPLYDRPNYLYFEVRNRGADPFTGGAVAAWSGALSGAHEFPGNWSRSPFFVETGGTPAPGNLVDLPFVPARDSVDGRAVAGPLVWHPRSPATGASCSDEALLMARVVQLNDPARPAHGDALEEARVSNNVALRRLPVVPAACVPGEDRYEENDRWETRKRVNETWRHLHARCPQSITRRLRRPYPDTECPGIFENGIAPASAEEIWTLLVPDLTLHGTTDRDYLVVRMPDLTDPQWQVNDINPSEVRLRGARQPFYEPAVMPECGIVQRTDPGPAGALSRRVNVSVSTELVVTAEPVATAGTPPRDLTGESLFIYRGGVLDEGLSGGSPLEKRIACPQSAEALRDLELSFGERTNEEGLFVPRSLTELGGYQIRLQYVSSIVRGIPDWANELNESRGIRTVPCRAGARAGAFPFCTGPGRPGPGGLKLDLFHPRTPGLKGCIADGPGCFELSAFEWPGGRTLDVRFSGQPLEVRLLDRNRREIARATTTGATAARRLQVPALKAGTYFLEIKGRPGRYAIEYQPAPLALPGRPLPRPVPGR